MTASERYVSLLCEKSFLPFWSYSSPLGKKGKELCDVLVVCGDYILIISVKDITISNHSDISVQYERWYKRAISASFDQLNGAERFLTTVEEIVLSDRKTTIKLPHKNKRKIYRLAIAFGSDKNFPIEQGCSEYGFIHVFDEESTFTVINELDTFPDFINYLIAKEEFAKGKRISVYKEVDFLALYLKTAFEFDLDGTPDFIVIDKGLWGEYVKSNEYTKWKNDIKVSFIWDEIVTRLFEIHINNQIESSKRNELDSATRLIALESRNNRITLGEAMNDAITNRKVRSRIIKLKTETNHAYVYLKIDSKNWEYKEKELELRCLIARELSPSTPVIIGIAIGVDPNNNLIFDYAYFDIPELNKQAIDRIKTAKNELGLFKNSQPNSI